MQRNATLLTLCATMFVVGCDSWPPYSERYESHFLENQSAFEALSAKFLATDYRRAALFDDGDTRLVIFHADVYDAELDAHRTRMFEEEDASWTGLLVQTRVFDVERLGHGITFWAQPALDELFSDLVKSDRVMSTRYTYEREPSGQPWLCKSEYEDLDCGQCSVPLVEGWSIQYSWAPDVLAPGALEQYTNGEISEQEYQKLWRENFEQCHLAGAKAMGYEGTM